MRTVFSQIFADSKEAYVREKLELGFRRQGNWGAELDEGVFNQQVANVIGHQLGSSVPIALPDAFYAITADQEAEIEARKRCVQAGLMRESPLLEGETIQEDLFTFLQQPLGTLPPNTAVLRRTTNMSEIFYLFDDVQVVAGDLRFIEPEPVPQTTVPRAGRIEAKGKVNAAFIGKSLVGGLVGGIGGKIGGLIFEAIFPPGVPNYFDEVYQEIGKVVKSELTQSTIDQINGRINGVVAFMKNTYRPRKEDGASRDELLRMVNPYVDLLYTEAVYTLMEPRYAKPGLAVFNIAAGVHLGLMQEQALVDPRQPDASQSSYAKSVKLNAQTYADHLNKYFDAIVNDRKGFVELVYDPVFPEDPNQLWHKDRYRFHDKFNDTWGRFHEEYKDSDKKRHSGEAEGEADRQQYIRAVLDKLTTNLGDPKNTASQLLKLTAKPIP